MLFVLMKKEIEDNFFLHNLINNKKKLLNMF